MPYTGPVIAATPSHDNSADRFLEPAARFTTATVVVTGDRSKVVDLSGERARRDTFQKEMRALAERVMHEAGAAPDERLARAFRIVTSRKPRAAEQAVLLAGFQRHLEHFQQHPGAAEKLLTVGERSADPSFNAPELAAYTAIANMLFNLDEAITQH